jgi:predicted ester cyclase
MSSVENKALITRYLDAISGKPKPESVLRLFIAEQQLIEHILVAEEAFPLYELVADEMIAEGDLVSIRGRIHGKHLGTLGNYAPTGADVSYMLYITYKVEGGKIVDHWMLGDTMTMMQQIEAAQAA